MSMGSDVSTPVEIKEPSYKVTVALDRSDIDAYGEVHRCSPTCFSEQTSYSKGVH